MTIGVELLEHSPSQVTVKAELMKMAANRTVSVLEAEGVFEKGKTHSRAPSVIIIVVQLLGDAQLFVTPWTAACQASLPFAISLSLLKLMSIESVMPSDHLILCHPLLLLSSIFPSIRVFSIESALRIRWSKYWSFSFSSSPSNECPGFISFRIV